MNGVPYHVAVEMSPTRRLAFVVAISELKGSRFDWQTMEMKAADP